MSDTPKQPATEAGRRHVARFKPRDGNVQDEIVLAQVEADVRDIEAEATAGLLALREALEEAADFTKQTLIDLPNERATRNVIAHLYRALADTAPAAAEIEARSIAKWLARPEAEQRLTAALRKSGARANGVEAYDDTARALLAALREQPATEKATEYTDEQFVAELRADGEYELADGVERALRAEVRRIAYLADDIERRRQADELANHERPTE